MCRRRIANRSKYLSFALSTYLREINQGTSYPSQTSCKSSNCHVAWRYCSDGEPGRKDQDVSRSVTIKDKKKTNINPFAPSIYLVESIVPFSQSWHVKRVRLRSKYGRKQSRKQMHKTRVRFGSKMEDQSSQGSWDNRRKTVRTVVE